MRQNPMIHLELTAVDEHQRGELCLAAQELGLAEEWLTPYVRLAAVRTWGAPCMTLLGSPEEVAAGIMAFKRAGIGPYILSGWPKQDAMVRYGREVIPLVRELEAADKLGKAAFMMAGSGRNT